VARQAEEQAYPARLKLDVQHFTRTLHITSYDELRKADHRAVLFQNVHCRILYIRRSSSNGRNSKTTRQFVVRKRD
jgi:hypothetical protein